MPQDPVGLVKRAGSLIYSKKSFNEPGQDPGICLFKTTHMILVKESYFRKIVPFPISLDVDSLSSMSLKMHPIFPPLCCLNCGFHLLPRLTLWASTEFPSLWFLTSKAFHPQSFYTTGLHGIGSDLAPDCVSACCPMPACWHWKRTGKMDEKLC